MLLDQLNQAINIVANRSALCDHGRIAGRLHSLFDVAYLLPRHRVVLKPRKAIVHLRWETPPLLHG